MLKTFLSCFLISFFTFPKSSEAEIKKLVAYHAPQSFYDVLKKLDEDSEILTANETWFQPSLATVWIVFLSSKSDTIMLPKFLLDVIELSKEHEASKFPLQRYKYALRTNPEQTVQIIDLSKTSLGPKFYGCIAAFEIHNYLKDKAQEVEKTISDCRELGY